MHFEFTDEQEAIRATARELLGSRTGGDGLWQELCELGWPGITVAEEHGGQGLGLVELALLAEQLGYACAPTCFLGTTLAALAIEHSGSARQREHWLPGLAAGEMTGALALESAAELVPDATPEAVLVLVDDAAATAALYAAGAIGAVEAIDSGRAHGRVAEAPTASEPLDGDVAAALDRAAVVVAAELLGLCRRALDLTVTYVKDRKQFGVPVGSFQAVQHAAAQMLRDTEATAAATYYAAWTADADPASLPLAASIAKALASDAARAVTAGAIQLHGGIGFTWEADLHWLFKRAQVGSVYLGGAAQHRARVSRLLAADRVHTPA